MQRPGLISKVSYFRREWNFAREATHRAGATIRVGIKKLLGGISHPLWRRQSPVFVLSTGRTGTDTLHHLYALSEHAVSEHEPRPMLLTERQRAFHEIDRNLEIYKQIFKKARGYTLLKTRLLGKVYIETSARMTFLAPAIKALLPGAKFIFMSRHPADIVRSGMRRGWYAGHPADPYRITPCAADPVYDSWHEMSPFEKICWYWSAYNRFSLKFFYAIEVQQRFLLKSEDFFDGDKNLISSIFQFAGLEVPSSVDVAQVMQRKINAQQDSAFPKFCDWSESQKQVLLRFARPEIERLGYLSSFESVAQ